MKITIVKDEIPEQLGFHILFTEPQEVAFNKIQLDEIAIIDKCIESIQQCGDPNSQLIGDLVNDLHASRDSRFDRAKQQVESDIYDMLWKKMPLLRTAVYNWVLDNQTDEIRAFIQRFEVERTTYDFDDADPDLGFDMEDDE